MRSTRALALVLACLLCAAPAWAQGRAGAQSPPLPMPARGTTNLGQTALDQFGSGSPNSDPVAAGQADAAAISRQIFGPSDHIDLAYGAFQRGYYLTALNLALKRAANDDPTAETLIGEIYANGLGVAQNATTAADWFKLASKHGDKLAGFELALMYQKGVGVPKDGNRAAALFEAAAKAGYMPAKYNMALLYIDGLYVKPDITRAAALMKEAAASGLPEAEYDYGSMLMQGAGVVPDTDEGARQIGLAAKAGLVSAELDYATLLYMGQGITKNLKEAALWYKKAAEAGNAVAQNRYAKLLAAGEGVDLDLQSAAMWRALARRQGLNDPVLDKLLVSISPKDLAEADERARFWPARPPSEAHEAPHFAITTAPANTPSPNPAPTNP